MFKKILTNNLFWLITLTTLGYLCRVLSSKASITYIPDTQIIRQAFDLGQIIISRRIFDIGLGDTPFKYPLVLPYYLLGIYGMLFGLGYITRVIPSINTFTTLLFTQRESIHFVAVLSLGIINALVIPYIYSATRVLNKTHLGWLAASLMAFDLISVQFGGQARPHAPLASLSFITVVACVRSLQNDHPWRWTLLSAFLGAVVFGTLQSGILIFVPMGLMWAMRLTEAASTRQFKKELLRAAASALLALMVGIITYPSLLQEYPQLVVNLLTGQSLRLGGGSHEFSTSMFGLANVPLFLWHLLGHEPIIAPLSLIAVPYFIWQQRANKKMLSVALSFPLLNLIMWGVYADAQPRYMLVLIPFLILAVAYWLEDICQHFVSPKIYLLIGLIVVAPTILTSLRFIWVANQTDTRTLASQWIKTAIPTNATLFSNFQMQEITPTKASLQRQQRDYPQSLGTYQQWLLQLEEARYTSPAYNVVDYSIYWSKDDRKAQQALFKNQAVQFVVIASQYATLQIPVANYAIENGTPLHTICPGRNIEYAQMPIDLYDGFAWHEIWQLERPGPIIIVFQLNETGSRITAPICP